MHSLRHLLHRYILLSSLHFGTEYSNLLQQFIDFGVQLHWITCVKNHLFLLSRCFVGKVNPLWMDIGRQAQNFFCTVNFVLWLWHWTQLWWHFVQMGPGLIMQPGQGYMTPQSYVSIAPRSAVHFNMSPLPAPAHESFLGQQGFVSGQEAMELRKIHLMTNEPFMAGGNGPNLSGGFAEYGQHVNVEGGSRNGQSGSGLQGSEVQPSESGSRQLQQDISVSSSDAGVQTGSIVGDGDQTADELEPSYLKASDDEGS